MYAEESIWVMFPLLGGGTLLDKSHPAIDTKQCPEFMHHWILAIADDSNLLLDPENPKTEEVEAMKVNGVEPIGHVEQFEALL
jgi:hypothetical protein